LKNETGKFLIKDEKFRVEEDHVIHTYKCAGDIGWARECQYIQIQCMIDRMVENESIR